MLRARALYHLTSPTFTFVTDDRAITVPARHVSSAIHCDYSFTAWRQVAPCVVDKWIRGAFLSVTKRSTCLLTLEVNGQTTGDDQQRDSVEEYLHESESQPPVRHVMPAGHVADYLKIISRIQRCDVLWFVPWIVPCSLSGNVLPRQIELSNLNRAIGSDKNSS